MPRPAAVTAGAAKQKLTFAYDGLGRRIQKKVYAWNASGAAYQLTSDTRFVYDGWNLLAELSLSGTVATVRCGYTWGADLSGSLQGAGGVGGLLFRTDSAATFAYAYDGNGNVSGLVNAADGTLSAKYDYNAFGETVEISGPAATSNLFRFSTKFTDAETGLVYYGYRYYNPSIGHWLSRDPIEEQGGANLLCIGGNDAVNGFDLLGLYQPDGHFYTVYILAMLNGKNAKDAYSLAYYAQYTDQDQRYDAIPAGKRLVGGRGDIEYDYYIQMLLHSLMGREYAEILTRRKCLLVMLRDSSLKDWEKGFIVHALGDAYSHTKGEGADVSGYSPGIGHLWDFTAPDIPSNRPQVFRDYLGALNFGLGGKVTRANLDSLSRLMTQEISSKKDRLQRARELAQRFGYSKAFDPAIDEALDPDMATISRGNVWSLFEKMKKACACGN